VLLRPVSMMLRRMYGAFDGAEPVSLESVRRTLETESQQRAQGRGEVFRRPAVPFGVSDLPKGATLGSNWKSLASPMTGTAGLLALIQGARERGMFPEPSLQLGMGPGQPRRQGDPAPAKMQGGK
jgi:hypothetical protein